MAPLLALAIPALFLAAGTLDAAPLRATHTEGVVWVAYDGIRAGAGRAEAVLADGALLHVDRHTDVRMDATGTLRVVQGRVLIRTAAGTPTSAALGIAGVLLSPGGIYGVLVDAPGGRDLITVFAGGAEVRTARAAAFLTPGQMTLILGAGSVPVPTRFDADIPDAFAQWSDQRVTERAAARTIPGPVDIPARAAPGRSAESEAWPADGVSGDAIWLAPGYGYGPRRGYDRRDPYAPRYEPRYVPRYDARDPRTDPSRPDPRRGAESDSPRSPEGRRGAPPRRELPPIVPPTGGTQPGVPPPAPAVSGTSRGKPAASPGTPRASSPGRPEPR